MPAIRLPESSESLLKFCRRHEQAEANACFETYADLVVFAASSGYHRLNGRAPSEVHRSIGDIYPIDIGVFKNQNLFPNLLLIGIGSEGNPEIARDEERLCRLVEAFAHVGCKYLAHELATWTPARFHLKVAELETAAIECRGNSDTI